MRSQVEISFYQQDTQIGRSQVLNQVDEHPDGTDFFSWDDLVSAIKAAIRYFAGDEGGAESDAKKEAEDLLQRLLRGNDHNVFRNSERSFLQGGAVQGIDQVVDEARIWFRAWSEDDLKKTSFGKVEDPSGQIRDLGERYFRKGDDKWYEHGFSLPLRTLPVGKYVFAFASRDEGVVFDVGVASTLVLSLMPALASHSGFLIQSRFGHKGNFELVVPRTTGGLAFFWRDNDAPGLPWNGPFPFAQNACRTDAVSLIQSNFSAAGNVAGNLEAVARIGERLRFFFRLDAGGPDRRPGDWQGPFDLVVGGMPVSEVSGNPALIQSRHGIKGNFELVVPLATGGLVHYWRDNDAAGNPWQKGPVFATELGRIDAVSLIQSNFSAAGNGPGNLELVARIGDRLVQFWRPDTPSDWQNAGFFADGVSGNPALIQSRYGIKGNFELVVPLAAGGLAHFWRDNDAGGLPWKRGQVPFGENAGRIDAVSLIQSNFSTAWNGPGNLELVVRAGARLLSFFRPDAGGPNNVPGDWQGPVVIAEGL